MRSAGCARLWAFEVVRLKRNAEGVVKLGMLKPGTYRELTKAEVNGLRAAAAKGRAQTRSAALQSRAAERRPRGPVGRGPAAGKKAQVSNMPEISGYLLKI